MRKIEIIFPVDIEPLDGFERLLTDLVDIMICTPYEKANPTRIMWPAGQGSKPVWSQADSLFLGKPLDSNAPAVGEPTFDDSVYCIEVEEREDYYGTNPNNPNRDALREGE